MSVNIGTLVVGDKVSTVDSISSKYAGQVGEVIKLRGGRFPVRVRWPNGKRNWYATTSLNLANRPERNEMDYKGYPVRALIRNGPAEKAGLRIGDIITAINGIKVKRGKLADSLKLGGDKVSISYTRDGLPKKVFGVKLTKNKSLGVISVRNKAAAYLAKLAREANKPATVTSFREAAKRTEKVEIPSPTPDKPAPVSEPTKEEVNYFDNLADEELKLANALLEDMKARDRLIAARDLRYRLQTSLKSGMVTSEANVDDYLNSLNTSDDEEEKPGRLSLTRTGRVVFTILGVGAIATAAGVASYFYGLVL